MEVQGEEAQGFGDCQEVTAPVPPGTPRVVPALLGYLGQRRRAVDVDLDAIVKGLPFAANRSEIDRWETGGSEPGAGNLDAVVATYATATGDVVSAIWGEALTRAISHPDVILG